MLDLCFPTVSQACKYKQKGFPCAAVQTTLWALVSREHTREVSALEQRPFLRTGFCPSPFHPALRHLAGLQPHFLSPPASVLPRSSCPSPHQADTLQNRALEGMRSIHLGVISSKIFKTLFIWSNYIWLVTACLGAAVTLLTQPLPCLCFLLASLCPFVFLCI